MFTKQRKTTIFLPGMIYTWIKSIIFLKIQDNMYFSKALLSSQILLNYLKQSRSITLVALQSERKYDFKNFKCQFESVFFCLVFQLYQHFFFSPGPLLVINFKVGIEGDNFSNDKGCKEINSSKLLTHPNKKSP